MAEPKDRKFYDMKHHVVADPTMPGGHPTYPAGHSLGTEVSMGSAAKRKRDLEKKPKD